MNLHSAARAAIALILASTLIACGGGGGTPSAADAPEADLARSPKGLAIKSFDPAEAAVGAEVRVIGDAMNTVTSVKVGSVAAPFSTGSQRELRFKVPAGAASARIELANGERAVLSSSELIVVGDPATPTVAIQSLSPETVMAPAQIAIAGAALDAVTQLSVNGVALPIVSKAATQIIASVPVGTTTGEVAFATATSPSKSSGKRLTVAGPMSIGSFAPTSAARGGSLTITGTNLDRATSVSFAGGSSSSISARNGATSITVVVPPTAVTGQIAVDGNLGDRVTSADVLTIVLPISVDSSAVYQVPSSASTVVISGSGLSSVTGVTVGTAAATLTARTDSQLSFVPPAGVACGSITLLATNQPAVPAGNLVVGAGCTLRSAGIEFAQSLSQVSGDSYQRLVPRKPVLLRAYVVSDIAGTPAPTVRIIALNGATVLGTLTMTGPAIVPQLGAGSALPGSLRYDESQSFNATLPASWVTAGLKIRVEIGGVGTVESVPAVGSSTRLDLVLVPVVSGSNAPTMPNVQDVIDELVRRMPIPRESISVSVRAPYQLSATNDGVDTSTEWSNALVELETLRRNEAPTKHYYGLIRPMVSAGTSGIGYINSIGATSYLSALGWDASRSAWRRTLIHELGHNFSRRHAPCGGAGGTDVNYPYSGGLLSDAPLWESIANDIVAPTSLPDVMGYCQGAWFSDYNYRGIQSFLEAQPLSSQSVEAGFSSEVTVITGRIGADGITLDPVEKVRGRARRSAAASDLRVRLTTVHGVLDVPVAAAEVDHVDERHFFAEVGSLAEITQIEVVQQGRTLPNAPIGRSQALAARTVTATSAPSINWSEVGSRLELSWDTTSTRAVSVTLVVNGTRTVLGSKLRGGAASIDLSAHPRGGELEFSLSSGLNSQVVVVPR